MENHMQPEKQDRKREKDSNKIKSTGGPIVMESADIWARFRLGLVGAVFSVTWWIRVDAVVYNFVKIPFLYYLPGILFPHP